MKVVVLLAGCLALAKGQGTPSELSCSDSTYVVPQVNRWCEIENTPTVRVQAPGCCNPTLNQIGEEDSQNNEGCRAVQTSAPYCPSPDCCDLTSNNALEINLLMSNTDTQGVCCDTCYCVGDPLCGLWREGELTRDIFVTCDGRVKKGKQACKMSKNICTKQKDHHGKKCKWKQGRWSSFLENGSPCQPDQNTEPAMMSMYTVTKGGVRYSLDLTLGERGVIKSATYSRVGGSTSSRMILNSDDCFKYNPRKYHVSESGIALDSSSITSSDLSANTVTYAKQAWMFSSPEMEALVTAVRLPNMVETEWSIVDPESGLEFDIRCSSPTAPPPEWDAVNVNEWVATSTRLDIPVAVLPKEKAQDQSTSSTEGFCSSGGISLVQSTSRRLASLRATQSDATRELLPFSATSNDLEFQDMCFNKWVKDYVEACREIVSPTCNPVNYAGYVEEWCFKCSHGFADPPETCVDKLTNTDKYDEATISENWREYIVEMNSIGASENALALLRADISMFSYKQLFGRGYAGDIVSCALRNYR